MSASFAIIFSGRFFRALFDLVLGVHLPAEIEVDRTARNAIVRTAGFPAGHPPKGKSHVRR